MAIPSKLISRCHICVIKNDTIYVSSFQSGSTSVFRFYHIFDALHAKRGIAYRCLSLNEI